MIFTSDASGGRVPVSMKTPSLPMFLVVPIPSRHCPTAVCHSNQAWPCSWKRVLCRLSPCLRSCLDFVLSAVITLWLSVSAFLSTTYAELLAPTRERTARGRHSSAELYRGGHRVETSVGHVVSPTSRRSPSCGNHLLRCRRSWRGAGRAGSELHTCCGLTGEVSQDLIIQLINYANSNP